MTRNYIFRIMQLNLKTVPSNLRSILERQIGYKKSLTGIRECDLEKDWSKLIFIMNKAFKDSPDFFDESEGLLRADESKKQFSKMKIFIAMIKNLEVGFIAISPKRNASGNKEATISLMAVIPEFHRKKIGTILAIYSYDWLIKEGVYDLYAKVGEDNIASYEFMKSLGFKEINREVIKGNPC